MNLESTLCRQPERGYAQNAIWLGSTIFAPGPSERGGPWARRARRHLVVSGPFRTPERPARGGRNRYCNFQICIRFGRRRGQRIDSAEARAPNQFGGGVGFYGRACGSNPMHCTRPTRSHAARVTLSSGLEGSRPGPRAETGEHHNTVSQGSGTAAGWQRISTATRPSCIRYGRHRTLISSPHRIAAAVQAAECEASYRA